MTDLTDLDLTERLHDVARSHPAPAPPIAALADRARRASRRRTALRGGLATVACAGLLGVGLSVLGSNDGDGPSRVLDPATTRAALAESGAWAVGNTVYLGDARYDVGMGGVVRSALYTGDGVLAHVGKDRSGDYEGPTGFVRIDADGTVTKVPVTLRDQVLGQDSQSSLIAWSERAEEGTGWTVSVLDTDTGSVVGTVDVRGDATVGVDRSTGRPESSSGDLPTFTWAGWRTPPVDVSGDRVLVGLDQATVVYDWRTGEQQDVDLPGSTVPEVENDRILVTGRTGVEVRDITTGKPVLTRSTPDARAVLSPDGRVLALDLNRMGVDTQMRWRTVDIASGTERTFTKPPREHRDAEGVWTDHNIGWTANGQLMFVNDGAREVCSPATGECTVHAIPGGPTAVDTLVMGGHWHSS